RPIELLAFPQDVQIFPGTRVNAVVATIGPAGTREAKLLVGQISTRRQLRIKCRVIERKSGLPTSFGTLLWSTKFREPAETLALSTLGRVRRGVATGANHFFFLTDDEAKAIPKKMLRPGIRRLREVDGDILDGPAHDALGKAGRRRWLLSLAGPRD